MTRYVASAGARNGRDFAVRAASFTGSPIDDSTSLLQSQTHDIVRLAMGSPASEAIPSEVFASMLGTALPGDRTGAYDYGPTEGEAGLRELLIEFLEGHDGVALAGERLLITSGGMQGLDLACKLFVDPGDLVAVESPTYTNGTGVIAGYGGEVLEVPTDEDGLNVEALRELASGREPKMIYVIPNFQNPSGVTLSLERREQLVELARSWGSVILEDDPYRQLRFEGDPLPSLEEMAAGAVRVVSVHTFSKILAPGLRVGWVTADADVVRRMVAAKQTLDTCTNVPMQRLVAGFMAAGRLDEHIVELRSEYHARKRDMQRALRTHFGDLEAHWTDPDGGFFLWLTLPEPVDCQALFPVALREGVAFIPGSAFSVSKRFTNALRLAFSATRGERTELGIMRLRAALDRYLKEL
jgi:2-aminoadipate transaminase